MTVKTTIKGETTKQKQSARRPKVQFFTYNNVTNTTRKKNERQWRQDSVITCSKRSAKTPLIRKLCLRQFLRESQQAVILESRTSLADTALQLRSVWAVLRSRATLPSLVSTNIFTGRLIIFQKKRHETWMTQLPAQSLHFGTQTYLVCVCIRVSVHVNLWPRLWYHQWHHSTAPGCAMLLVCAVVWNKSLFFSDQLLPQFV